VHGLLKGKLTVFPHEAVHSCDYTAIFRTILTLGTTQPRNILLSQPNPAIFFLGQPQAQHFLPSNAPADRQLQFSRGLDVFLHAKAQRAELAGRRIVRPCDMGDC
jgi:hypothetical protein